MASLKAPPPDFTASSLTSLSAASPNATPAGLTFSLDPASVTTVELTFFDSWFAFSLEWLRQNILAVLCGGGILAVVTTALVLWAKWRKENRGGVLGAVAAQQRALKRAELGRLQEYLRAVNVRNERSSKWAWVRRKLAHALRMAAAVDTLAGLTLAERGRGAKKSYIRDLLTARGGALWNPVSKKKPLKGGAGLGLGGTGAFSPVGIAPPEGGGKREEEGEETDEETQPATLLLLAAQTQQEPQAAPSPIPTSLAKAPFFTPADKEMEEELVELINLATATATSEDLPEPPTQEAHPAVSPEPASSAVGRNITRATAAPLSVARGNAAARGTPAPTSIAAGAPSPRSLSKGQGAARAPQSTGGNGAKAGAGAAGGTSTRLRGAGALAMSLADPSLPRAAPGVAKGAKAVGGAQNLATKGKGAGASGNAPRSSSTSRK